MPLSMYAQPMGPTMSIGLADGATLLRSVSARRVGVDGVCVTVGDCLTDCDGDEVRSTSRLEVMVRASACTPALADALLVVAGALV